MVSQNMLLLTNCGYEEIKELQKEINVCLYDLKTYPTKIEKQGKINMYNVLTACSDSLLCDSNNMFLTRRFDIPSQNIWKPVLWITAQDFIAVPINQKSFLPKMKKHKKIFKEWFEDKKFWDFVGYILDDFKIISNRIYTKNTRDSKKKLNELKWDYKILKSTNEVVITSPALAYFLNFFKDDKHNFIIPYFVINLPKNILTILLRYIFNSASRLNSEYQLYQHTDKKTIYHLASCVAKLYNTIYLIHNNTVVNQKETFSLTFSKTIQNNAYGIYKDNYLWYKVNSIIQTLKMEESCKIKNSLNNIILNGVLLSI